MEGFRTEVVGVISSQEESSGVRKSNESRIVIGADEIALPCGELGLGTLDIGFGATATTPVGECLLR